MGQKTNPIGNRLGIIRGWESNWYGGNDYGDKLAEDDKIRKYIFVRLAKASVSRVIIERTLKLVTVTITTARPGIIIGKGGQEVDKLKEELRKLTNKEVQLNIFEIKYLIYLNDSLIDHCVCNFNESGNIGAFYIINSSIVKSSIFGTCLMNRHHDRMKLFIHFFRSPRHS